MGTMDGLSTIGAPQMDTATAIMKDLDFGQTLDVVLEIPRPMPANIERAQQQLESDTAAGHLSMVVTSFYALQECGPDEIWWRQPGSSLWIAITKGYNDIVAFLLMKGVAFDLAHVREATMCRNMQVLQMLLSHDWDINQPYETSYPPTLSFALMDKDVTTWYLDHGADPNATCLLDMTPLSVAARTAPFEIIKLLFDRGASVNSGQPVHHAVWRDSHDTTTVVEFILNKGAAVNQVMYSDYPQSYAQQKMFALGTPLHYAAERGDYPTVKLLLAYGADCNVLDSCGELPFERALRNNHTEVVRILYPF